MLTDPWLTLGEESTLVEDGLEGEPPTLHWICSYALTSHLGEHGNGLRGEVEGLWTGREEGMTGAGLTG